MAVVVFAGGRSSLHSSTGGRSSLHSSTHQGTTGLVRGQRVLRRLRGEEEEEEEG